MLEIILFIITIREKKLVHRNNTRKNNNTHSESNEKQKYIKGYEKQMGFTNGSYHLPEQIPPVTTYFYRKASLLCSRLKGGKNQRNYKQTI